MLHAWVSGRSLARGLPAPVEDRGGLRVDTASEGEVCRWVFDAAVPGLTEIGRAEGLPGRVIKLCGTADELRRALSDLWQIEATGYFMALPIMKAGDARLPAGYTATVSRKDAVAHAVIVAPGGEPAASGYAADTPRAFVFDRIVTNEAHRRRGLGTALMTLLANEKRTARSPGLLVATEAGRALYATLGWHVLSPYSTATVAAR